MAFPQEINSLLTKADARRSKLQAIYAQIPSTRCQRRAQCCSMLPEMSPLEALIAVLNLKAKTATASNTLLPKIVHYFFMNPIKVTSCPFLEENTCRIYNDRFFGCRAYGLWTPSTFDQIARVSRRGKKHLQAQWLALGVALPDHVVHFQAPYCRDVVGIDRQTISDHDLFKLHRQVDELSSGLTPWHQAFKDLYFSDLSVAIASWLFGRRRAVQLKFLVVKDALNYQRHSTLDQILNESTNLF